MSKRLLTDPDEIYKALIEDATFTEATCRDEEGNVYIMGADGSKRYITQLEVEVREKLC